MTGVLSSCKDKAPSTTLYFTVEDFQKFGENYFTINSHTVHSVIDSMIRNDSDDLMVDIRVRKYYKNNGNLLWINRHGLISQADTLLEYLKTVQNFGFSPKRFYVTQIEDGIRRVREADYNHSYSANLILGKLEFQLTKAYLRYVSGQRFGYTNPHVLFNRLDTLKPNRPDTLKKYVRFRSLFDVKMDTPSDLFYEEAIAKIVHDSVACFLKEVQPQGEFYKALLEDYKKGKGTQEWRNKLLCNMERCRWRQEDYPQKHKNYVVVNIPSFHLLAVYDHDTLTMRIGCGSFETKTPLLSSAIKRIEVNPQWIVPRSIIEKDMIHYFSRYYCERKGFFVMDRRTGKEVNMNSVYRSMILDPNYAVVQRGGKGNSLGRLIFRFDNNFSVYLHDTSSRDFFSRADRGVSHGCVRVEKPFELAKFLLKDKNEQFYANLYYCMTADSLVDRKRIIRNVKVEPQIPLFITYYTIYPMKGKDRKGWEEYPDVYGYDKVIYKYLKKYYK